MEDIKELEELYNLPTVDEPLTIEKVSEENEEKFEDVCMGTAKSNCANPAVVKVRWQSCLCGKIKTTSIHCIKCYESYKMIPVGSTSARAGECGKCGMTVYMINVGPIR